MTATCFWARRRSSSLMALMREAEVWAEGEASSGGYSGVGEVRRRGGADGSRNEELGIWKTEEEENSGNDKTCRERPENQSRLKGSFVMINRDRGSPGT